MVVTTNEITNAIVLAENVAYLNAQARANTLRNGETPCAEDDAKAIEIEQWIAILQRAEAQVENGCIDSDDVWNLIQKINEQNRDVDCNVTRIFSRRSSSGGGGNVPSGYVERVLGVNVDNTNPSRPVIEIFVNPLTISGDGTQAAPFSSIGAAGNPAGSNKQIQFNNSGVFGGAKIEYTDNGTEQLLESAAGDSFKLLSDTSVIERAESGINATELGVYPTGYDLFTTGSQTETITGASSKTAQSIKNTSSDFTYQFQGSNAPLAEGELDFSLLTANRNYKFQDSDGTLAFLSDITGSGNTNTVYLNNLAILALQTGSTLDLDTFYVVTDA